MLANVLKKQISKQYKEHGETFVKLWNGYFNKIIEEHKDTIQMK